MPSKKEIPEHNRETVKLSIDIFCFENFTLSDKL